MLTTTEGTAKDRKHFGNIFGIPIRYHNFPLPTRHCSFIWRRHPSDCRLKGSPHRTKGHSSKNQGGFSGLVCFQACVCELPKAQEQ